MDTSRLLGVPDAARYLELSERRVKVLAREGRVGSMVAGRYLFEPADLARFKKKKRFPGRPKAIPD